MGIFHMTYGWLLMVLTIIVMIIEMVSRKGVPRALRGITIGLMDLQLLIGIITWIVGRHWGFIWHPIFMIVAVIVAHIFTGSRRSRSSRIMGWVVTVILFLIGAFVFG